MTGFVTTRVFVMVKGSNALLETGARTPQDSQMLAINAGLIPPGESGWEAVQASLLWEPPAERPAEPKVAAKGAGYREIG